MNLLLAMILYLTVGCGEWYLALRRTLACARGEKTVLVCIVFIENLLGLWVLSSFIRTNNWLLALSYATGAAAGARDCASRAQAFPKRRTEVGVSCSAMIERRECGPVRQVSRDCSAPRSGRRRRPRRSSRPPAASC